MPNFETADSAPHASSHGEQIRQAGEHELSASADAGDLTEQETALREQGLQVYIREVIRILDQGAAFVDPEAAVAQELGISHDVLASIGLNESECQAILEACRQQTANPFSLVKIDAVAATYNRSHGWAHMHFRSAEAKFKGAGLAHVLPLLTINKQTKAHIGQVIDARRQQTNANVASRRAQVASFRQLRLGDQAIHAATGAKLHMVGNDLRHLREHASPDEETALRLRDRRRSAEQLQRFAHRVEAYADAPEGQRKSVRQIAKAIAAEDGLVLDGKKLTKLMYRVGDALRTIYATRPDLHLRQ